MSGRPHQSFYAKHEAVILGSLSVVLLLGVWQAGCSAGLGFAAVLQQSRRRS